MNEVNNEIVVVEQKTVSFQGADLLGVKASNGKIYVGVRWICEGIRLTEDQMKNERKRIKADVVLKRGGLNLTLLTKRSHQEVSCIELDFLPLWLAKISITPTMIEQRPDITQKLVEYQLKAKDVLAEAFLPKPQTASSIEDLIIMQAQSVKEMRVQVQQISHDVAKSKQTLIKVEKKIDSTAEILALNPTGWRKKTSALLAKIAETRDDHPDYQAVRKESYRRFINRTGCKLDVRVQNIRKNMEMVGVSQSKRDKVNYLDAIEKDPKLVEIYLAVVKDMAIQYQVKWEEVETCQTTSI